MLDSIGTILASQYDLPEEQIEREHVLSQLQNIAENIIDGASMDGEHLS